MNKCFLIGYLDNEVDFSFTLKKQPISVAKIHLKLSNKTNIFAYSFDEIADYCYRKLKKGDCVFIEGMINSETNVIVEKIYKL